MQALQIFMLSGSTKLVKFMKNKKIYINRHLCDFQKKMRLGEKFSLDNYFLNRKEKGGFMVWVISYTNLSPAIQTETQKKVF